MRKLIRSLPLATCLLLAACNFPTPRTAVAPTDTEFVHPTRRPAETKTAEPVPATATPEPEPTSGPIPHLASGTALAVNAIDMIDTQNGWAVGGDTGALLQDHVFRTEDGGSTWKDVTPPEPTVVRPSTDRIAVGAFWDAENAWATFYSANLLPPPTAPVVWRTTDGGNTWRPSAPLDLSGWVGEFRISDLFFINIQTGWVMAHKGDDPASDRIALYQTVNGGNTWERVIDPAVDSGVQDCEKTGILFTGPWVGWMTGDCHGARAGVFLYQTFDGGKSWVSVKLPSPATPPGMLTTTDFSCRIHAPVFFAQDTNLILVVECASKTAGSTASNLYSNSPGGWHIIPRYPGGRMAVRSPGDGRVFRGDVQSGLAVGKDVYAYNGASNTWEKIGSIDWTGQFDFVDWNRGWAAARKGETPLLMYTADGGRTWEDLQPTVK